MNGTEWAEPGQGAHPISLSQAAHRSMLDMYYMKEFRAAIENLMPLFSRNQTTNLRLTGAPLTAEDLKRIAKCK